MAEPALGRLEELWLVVRRIPRGFVASYGAVGRSLERPVSGLVVGKWMARAPEGVPWWRVVAADGRIVLSKRDPALGAAQRALLEREGVQFLDDKVAPSSFIPPEALW